MASITVVDAAGTYSFTAAAGGETVDGSGATGALTVYGGSDSELIAGGSGADTLVAGTGADTFVGGAGANTFVIGAIAANAGVHYVIDDWTSSDSLLLDSSGTAASLLQNATVGAGGVTLTLSNGATVRIANLTSTAPLIGRIAVPDGVVSTSPVPVIFTAADTLFGGGGGGTLVTAAGDSIFGGAGSAETVTGNSVNGLSINSTGSFNLFTAAGDTLSGSAGAETITGSAGSVTLLGATNGETLSGGANTHTITGGAGNDTLIAGAGNVTLTGGAGNDYLDGGIGTDVAVYTGPRASYLVTTLPGGAIQITDERAGSPDGTDTDLNIAEFQFSDGLFSAASLLACYCRGTQILTDKGEVAVEDLKIGDRVVTASGAARPIKWIGRRSYGGRFLIGQKHILPICIKAGAWDVNTPRRDLWISPHHAMYLEGVLIEARDLVNGVSIVQPDDTATVEYFHIELNTHDVIMAEGSLSETFIDDDSRGMFHNGQEYALRYPEEHQQEVRYYAPRCDSGYEVEAARQRIEGRAGLRPADTQHEQITLRGYVDKVGPDVIEGWAQNAEYPEAPVCLDIYVGDRMIGQTLANRYREDLKQAGLGNGHHSFIFVPLPGTDISGDVIQIRRSLDGVTIASSKLAINDARVA